MLVADIYSRSLQKVYTVVGVKMNKHFIFRHFNINGSKSSNTLVLQFQAMDKDFFNAFKIMKTWF